jgi:hypothetical protein
MKKLIIILLFASVCCFGQQKPALITISNHPLGNNITRKVEPIGYTHFWNESSIRVHVLVYHYKNDTLINTASLKTYEDVLTTNYSATRMVDSDGVTLLTPTDSTYARPDGLALKGTPLKQYDYFNGLILGGAVNIPLLIRAVILQEDLVFKRFNR